MVERHTAKGTELDDSELLHLSQERPVTRLQYSASLLFCFLCTCSDESAKAIKAKWKPPIVAATSWSLDFCCQPSTRPAQRAPRRVMSKTLSFEFPPLATKLTTTHLTSLTCKWQPPATPSPAPRGEYYYCAT